MDMASNSRASVRVAPQDALGMNNPQFEDKAASPFSKHREDIPYAFSRILNARPAIVLITLLLIGLLVFRDFIFGNKVLLYKGAGSDSTIDYFPIFAHISDYLRNNGLPSWSFSVGMGQSLFYVIGYLVLDPVVWLPKASIPYCLVYQHLAKVMVAGLLFWGFLRLRGLTFRAALAGCLLVSFSAYMCMGSCWIVLADELVCFSFVLFAAEQSVRRGRWIYVPLAVALASLITVFHLYLCALLLCFYVPARLVELYGWRPWDLSRSSVQLGAVAFLGIGLAAISCLGSGYSALNTPRGFGNIANFRWESIPSIYQLESPLYYVTAGSRAFSNDILGTDVDFRGWRNYLEAPANYCGLLSLLLFPQVFIGASRRQRILYGLFLSFVIVPTVFPWFRHLFWLFKGGYFRAFSLFCIFGIITLSVTAFSRYIERRTLNLWVLGGTLLVLMGALYLPIHQMRVLINPGLRDMAAIFLLVYAALLTAGHVTRREGMMAWVILGLAGAELIHFDRITVSNHPTVTKSELNERVGYNDETVDAVRDIKRSDNSFFRIRKPWGSAPTLHDVSFNDAMVFGYYGTSSYSSFNDLNYIKFLVGVEAISSSELGYAALQCHGLTRHALLSTFACEKYLLTKDPVLFQTADYYEFVKRFDNVYLFRNQLFLPLGLTFSDYISEDMFLQLPGDWAKPLALLHSVVLSNKDAREGRGLSPLSTQELRRKMIETTLPDIVAERRRTAFNIRSFSETRIEGTIRVDGKSILVLQTPFDIGWNAFLDDRPAQTLKVDVGLLGVMLEGGQHRVELRFRPPFLYTGAVVSLLSFAVLFLSLWKWPRICLPQ